MLERFWSLEENLDKNCTFSGAERKVEKVNKDPRPFNDKIKRYEAHKMCKFPTKQMVI